MNAFVASLQNAEKSSLLDLYINTHWITTIVVFAGASRLLMISSWASEIFSLMLQLLCFCVVVNAMVADFWNLRILSALNGTMVPAATTISYLKLYNSMDALLCVIAVLLSSYIIYQHFYLSAASSYSQTPSVKLLGMGTALVVLGVIRFACYFCEFFKLAGQDRLRALFANYTLDEPAWICVQLTLGVLWRSVPFRQGSKTSSVALTLALAVFHWLNAISLLTLWLRLHTISLDVYTIWKKLFYRLFHGAEQKTPFPDRSHCHLCDGRFDIKIRSYCCSRMHCFIVVFTKFDDLSTDLIFVSLVEWLLWRSALRVILPPELGRCFLEVTKTEAIIHFIQMLLDFSVLILSCVLCACSMRITTMAKTEVTGNRRLEPPIRWLGVLMALCGLTVLVQAILFFRTSTDLHPMVVVYMALYHMALAIGLIIFPLYQILCSEKLSTHPLSQTALLILSVVRFVEILTQLDYRGTGDDLSFAWKVHQTADFIALISHFATAMLVIRLMGNDIVEADELQLRFNNPLTLEENGDYLQLRPQEDSIEIHLLMLNKDYLYKL
ncbi:hypothetical protein COOONC_20875 [Cooperia oncophora]